ncbi:MBL fold metallo-hydrolase [uncultured Hoeflea sp.]|uniref:MBL fold metallo-hydrolase n=1 Tax=uncultured Hoeflea sp. TaxID=538666 RepID=UPI0030ECEB82|tara:strand:+ start:168088 stop:169050 length:963 start_codon:yes stop_codon:yes gene_type:complete
MTWKVLAATTALAAALLTSHASAETKFVTLGTQGGPITSPHRGQPSNLLVVNGVNTLVDVGDGTAERLSKIRIPTARVDNILISHLHFDHMAGLQGILGLRFQTNSPKPVQVYGPPGTKELVDGLLASMKPSMEAGYGVPGQKSYTAEELVVAHDIKGGDSFELGDVKVKVSHNTHYSFEPGSDEHGKYQSLSFRFETPDKIIAFTGDTGPSTDVEELSKGADMLIAEMIDVDFTVEQIKMINPKTPEDRLNGIKTHLAAHHLTPTDLGVMAANAAVKELVVTHLIPGSAMTAEHFSKYGEEIAAKYSGKVTFANDMDEF